MIRISKSLLLISALSVINVLLAVWLYVEYVHNPLMQYYLSNLWASGSLTLPLWLFGIAAIVGGSFTIYAKRHRRIRGAMAGTGGGFTSMDTYVQGSRPLKNSSSRGTLLRLFAYVRPHWPYVVAAGISTVANTAVDLAPPWIIGFLLVGEVIVGRNMSLLTWVIVLLAGAYVAKQITDFSQQYFTETLGQRTLHAIRYQLYQRLEHLPMRFFDNSRVGDLVARVISDTEEVENVVTSGISSIAANLILTAGILVVLFYVNSRLALVILPLVVAVPVAVNLFKRIIKRSARRIRDAVGELAGRVDETVSGIKIVKSFSMEEHEAQKFHTQSTWILRSRVSLAKLAQWYTSTVDLLQGSAVIFVVAIGTPSVLIGGLALGALIALLGYVDKLFKPVTALSKANFGIQAAVSAGERIFEIIDTGPETVESPTAIEVPIVRGEIMFDRVSFWYDPSNKVLNDLSFRVEAGEIVAVVGRSGVGKSTLVNLLLRFYEPTSGRILIDGHPINEWKLGFLRKRIAVVLQDPILFSGSIRENIRYGDIGASDEEIVEAAKSANAHDFTVALPRGYNTQVGERGVKLSTGQRQRIAIARALLKNPAILIMDEATSNVDSESEFLIQDALRRLSRKRTIIIIGHRLSTIMNASKIVVLEDGVVAEIGTHEELLVRGQIYSRLYEPQLEPRRYEKSVQR